MRFKLLYCLISCFYIISCSRFSSNKIQNEDADFNFLEIEFLKHVIDNDSSYRGFFINNYCIMIEFEDLNLYPLSADSSLKKNTSQSFDAIENKENCILVNDKGFVDAYYQVLKNNFGDFTWYLKSFSNNKIISGDVSKDLQYVHEDKRYFSYKYKKYCSGIISMSKPIFFNNGNNAYHLLHVKGSENDWKSQMNLYQKEEGVWELIKISKIPDRKRY